MTEGESEVLRSIDQQMTRQTVLMETLLAPGGRIPRLEDEVRGLNNFRIKAETSVRNTATFYGIISGGLGIASHWLLDIFRSKH